MLILCPGLDGLQYRYRHRFEQPDIQVQLGFLYEGEIAISGLDRDLPSVSCPLFAPAAYAREVWWFEMADMANKLALTSLIAFFHPTVQVCHVFASFEPTLRLIV